MGVWARGACKNSGPHMYFYVWQETTFTTKIGGFWAMGASKKIETPYLFL